MTTPAANRLSDFAGSVASPRERGRALRRGSACGSVAAVGSCFIGWAHAAEPCAELAPTDPLRIAHARLNDRTAADVGATAMSLLPSREDAAGRACAHYLLGSVAFFESVLGGPERAREAVRHLATAQSLAPGPMAERRPRKRLENAWKRIGVAGSGWDPGRGTVPVRWTLPVGASTLAWAPDCGDTPCDAASSGFIEVPLYAGATERVLTTPLGGTRARVTTPCGQTEVEVQITGAGQAVALPTPACIARLEVAVEGGDAAPRAYDADGRPLADLTRVDVARGPLWVAAPEHRPRAIVLPAAGGTVSVRLDPCRIRLEPTGAAAGARVEPSVVTPGDEPTVVRLLRAGYAVTETEVSVPIDRRATHCAPDWAPGPHGAFTLPDFDDLGPWPVEAALARPVRVTVRGGSTQSISTFVVGGVVSSAESLALVPGEYAWSVADVHGAVADGALLVPECLEATCPEVSLDLAPVAPPADLDPYRGSTVLTGAGAVLTLGGLLAGWAAIRSQTRIDDYTNKRAEGESVASLEQTRDERVRLANALVGLGGAALVGGVTWLWLEPGPGETR